MNVLLIGSGGREHALAWKLAQSKDLGTLYTAPGNPGTAKCGKNIDIGVNDADELVNFAKQKSVGLVVVGPEDP
ncbi:MAG: phosphoribosylamine--glycine ligase, partial [Planctomycetota bacterium]